MKIRIKKRNSFSRIFNKKILNKKENKKRKRKKRPEEIISKSRIYYVRYLTFIFELNRNSV